MACIACCSSGCTSQTDIPDSAPPAQGGRFFVAKPGAVGVYTEMKGKIHNLDCSDMEVEVDGQQMLFERKVVRRVDVEDKTSEIGKKAANCWNQQESVVLPLLKSLVDDYPMVGSFLVTVVENLNSPHVQTTLGIVILLAGLLFIAYRVYDFFYVAGNERNLNLEKLNLEVRKLRCELDGLEKQMGVQPPIRHAPESGGPIQDRVRARFELPKLHVRDFVKYKILRMLTEQQKMQGRDRWIKTWQAAAGNPKGSRLRYFLIMTAYGFGVTAAALLVPAFGLGVLLSLSDASLGESFGVTCLVLTLVFLSVLLRLLAQRRIVRDSYRAIYHAPR